MHSSLALKLYPDNLCGRKAEGRHRLPKPKALGSKGKPEEITGHRGRKYLFPLLVGWGPVTKDKLLRKHTNVVIASFSQYRSLHKEVKTWT